jgi:outer membrane protein assembly factor BamE
MSVTFPSCARRTAVLVLALVVTSVPLAGCASLGVGQGGALSSVNGWVTPYKPDLLQGNFVSQEQVQALKPGMSRQQVRDILGTPLLASAFHAQRWEYVFVLERQKLERQFFKMTVFFTPAGTLDRTEGDTMPTEAEFAARIDLPRDHSKVPVLEASEADLKAFAPSDATAPSPQAAAVDAPVDAPLVYPPLEPPVR